MISVETKKKEKVGDFANGGSEWHRLGESELVRVHDFEDKRLGRVAPYGVYDLSKKQGWVSVGIDHDIAENWRGKPLALQEVIVKLIANTTHTKAWKLRLSLILIAIPPVLASVRNKCRRLIFNGRNFTAIGIMPSCLVN